MTAWDIDPSGVRVALQRTQHAAAGFARAGKSYGAGASLAAANCDSPVVASAIAGFADHHENTLPYLATKTAATLTGAVQATNAYLKGDLEMAERAQHRATQAGTPHTLRLR